jgi:hypothetical protein
MPEARGLLFHEADDLHCLRAIGCPVSLLSWTIAELPEPIVHEASVVLVFGPETLATFFQLVTMVEELHSLFEPDGDE